MPQISVIVPVYNAETYLKRCVASILAQTLSDYELILVNDGSCDGSAQLCDEYSESYSHVRVIHQNNQGVSAARQTGLDAAKGEFVIFADPDDWIESTMLTEMQEKAEQENSDVVICDYWFNYEHEEHYSLQQPEDIRPSTVLRQLLLGQLHGSTCNKLYRLKLIHEHSISFPKGINYCEDLWFNCSFIHDCSPRVSYLNKAFYHYDLFSNSDSLSRVIRHDSLVAYKKFSIYAISHFLSSDDGEIIMWLKYHYKNLAFRSDCDSLEYEKIYPELNKCFTKILKSSNQQWAYKYSELLALRGYLKLGRRLVWHYENTFLPVYENTLYPIRSRIKKLRL